MSIEMKEKIRPLYSEFQGYLSQAPTSSKSIDSIDDEVIWNQYNDALRLLCDETGKDYFRFRIDPKINQISSRSYVRIDVYRQKLGGLISYLHGEYFSDETPPFSGMPSTVINTTQQQTTSIQLALDLQTRIDELLPNLEAGSKKQKFLEKFRSILSTISNVNDLIGKCMKLAHENGLNVQDMVSLWSG